MATNVTFRAGSGGGSNGNGSATSSTVTGPGLQQRRYSRYSKKQERPYPKGDITVEIQKKAQELLRDAAQRYEGFNASNLEIIAVSFEHKTFAESASSTDYIRKIKLKLNEWHYQDANQVPAPLKDLSKANHSSPNSQKRGSDSSSGPVKITNQRPSSRDSKSKQPQSVLNTNFNSGGSPSMQNAPQPGGSPSFNFNTPTSPGGGQQPTTPPFAPFSPTINPTGEFVGLTHPSLLDSLDLNDPSIRNQWITALRDSIVTDMRDQVVAEVYSSLGSGSMAPLMNGRNGQMDFGVMEVDQSQSTNGNGTYGMDSNTWYQSYNPHAVNVGNPSAGGGLYQPIGNDAQSFNQHMVGNWYNHQ